MKKTIKILLILLFAFISLSVVSKVEAASASISASKTTATVGDSITINVSFNAAAWNLKVSGTGVTATSYADTTNDGENAKTTKSLKLDTSTEGTKTIKLTGDVSDGTTGATTIVNKSVTVTINKKETNNNSNNSNNNNTTTPDPAPTFTSVNETVYAKSTANIRSSYSTTSSIVGSLKAGDSVTRTGIGSNGWSKISYNGQTAYVSSSLITKTKPEEPKENETEKEDEKEEEQEKVKLQLSSLRVKNYDLDPEFSKDIYEYELNVENDIEKLEIEAISDDKDVIIEVAGNENLNVGENNITITITKEKSEEKVIYTIKAIKEDKKVEQTENVIKINQDGLNEEIDRVNTNLKVRIWTIRGIIIFVTILIIIIFILRYFTTREDDYEDDYEYMNIKQKFNELNNLVDKEEQQEIVDEKEENQDEQEDMDREANNDYNEEYKIKRNKRQRGKHF